MDITVFVPAFLAVLLTWLLVRVLAGDWFPRQVVEGADGRLSTSKIQWLIWTVVIVFSYMAIFGARLQKGNFEVITEIPANVIIAMGLSLGTMTAAKIITVRYVMEGKVAKKKVDTEKKVVSEKEKEERKAAGLPSLVRDDEKYLDLSKIQMLVWTFVAIAVYLARVVHETNLDLPALPDIDASLMVLMGLGEGAYLGKKLVSVTAPRLNGLSPGSGKPGDDITIMGASFGEKQEGSQITINNLPFHPDPKGKPTWKDTEIKFKLPQKPLDTEEWTRGQQIKIGVIVKGQSSSNTLSFTVIPE